MAATLGRSIDDIGLQAPLFDLGVDSLAGLALRQRLLSDLADQHHLPPTLVFDHPTLSHLARHILHTVLGVPDTATVASDGDDLANHDAASLDALLRAELSEPHL